MFESWVAKGNGPSAPGAVVVGWLGSRAPWATPRDRTAIARPVPRLQDSWRRVNISPTPPGAEGPSPTEPSPTEPGDPARGAGPAGRRSRSMTVTRVKWSARTRAATRPAMPAPTTAWSPSWQLARGAATQRLPCPLTRPANPAHPCRSSGVMMARCCPREQSASDVGDYTTPARSHRRGRRDETWPAAAGRRTSWSLAADGLEEVHHELVDPLGGVGLHPVAGLGDPLDQHLQDPGAVRLGQLPAQVAVLVPQMTRVGMSTRRKVCIWARRLARTAAR